MNERGLVEVPENAVRDESLAFGLTATQLGICGAGVGLGALLNLLPLWLPLKVVLIAVAVAPVVLAAILPIRGEPAYRWILRAIRFRRGRRTWRASLERAPDKSQISGLRQDATPASNPAPPGSASGPRGGDWQAGDTLGTAQDPTWDQATETSQPGPARDAPGSQEPRAMGDGALRLRIVSNEEDPGSPGGPALDGEPAERPSAVPHVLAGLRLVATLGFAGGTGKTTLAVEIATLVAARARVRTIDGAEQAVRVLVLDAARLASAVGLRLGLAPAALSASRSHRIWRDPSAVGELAEPTRWNVDVVTLPPHPQLAERDGHLDGGQPAFGVLEADALLEGAGRAGYHLVVADLGGVLEDGHRQLIDQSDVVLGVVRPTLESLPDAFRLATVLRAQGMGRKLVLVANAADDDTEIGRLAREAEVPLAGRISADPVFTEAADRGEPAWSMSPTLAGELAVVARAAWPLLGEGPARKPRRRSLLGAVRSIAPAPGDR